ncbi:MAG: transposase [Candidatus Omnitrophota bacterium]
MDILERIENKKIKGYLMINKRIIFEGAVYHLTQRAPGKELLFGDDSDYLYFLRLLKDVVKKFNLELFSFALLPNHLHLLLRIKETNLSQAMKNLFERYAKYFNEKNQRKGHVFCGRYRASLCNDDRYLIAVSIYIHLNPYNSGICSDYKTYRWSSLGLYMGGFKKTFIDYKYILSFLDDRIEEASKKYINMLAESVRIKTRKKVLLEPFFIKQFIWESFNIIRASIKRESDSDELDGLVRYFRGQKRVVQINNRQKRRELIERLLSSGYSVKEIIDMLAINRATFHRIKHCKD